jgi:tetratricopeptide (TPR) repeat protein
MIENRPQETIAEFEIGESLHDYPAYEVLRFAGYEMRYGHPAEAKAHCQKVLRTSKDPDTRAVAWTNLGVANMLLNDPAQAQDNFEKARQTVPHYSYANIGLGLLAERRGDFRQAADFFSSAVKIEPNDLGYFLLATALEKDGRPAEASAAFAQAQRLSANMAEVVQRAHELLP